MSRRVYIAVDLTLDDGKGLGDALTDLVEQEFPTYFEDGDGTVYSTDIAGIGTTIAALQTSIRLRAAGARKLT